MSTAHKGKNERLDNRKLYTRRICLMVLDCLCIALAGIFSLLVRFDFVWKNVEPLFKKTFWYHLPFELIAAMIIFWLFHLYRSLWAYAGMQEMMNIAGAGMVLMVVDFIIVSIAPGYLPRSFYPLSAVYTIVLLAGTRLSYRYIRRIRGRSPEPDDEKNIMIIGAGEAGVVILREIVASHHLSGNVRCLIDDDRKKIGNYVHGVKVVGGRETILKAVKRFKIDMIIIAMPSQSQKQLREILTICKDTDCELKILPGIYQLVNNEVTVQKLRNVEINDLLGREQVIIQNDTISGYVSEKVVLVTGGGGSIGSELCRQIAANQPKQLIIFDIYENNAYDIQQELLHNYPDLNLVVLIGSVRNTNRVNSVFNTYHPQIVFHAAAHKHVPLMEMSPDEAIKNNVFGTWKTAQAADKYGAEKFILISTDKAVNPTNIMGASKRICEMIIQTWNNHSKTEFAAVRFGNVLGSNGSVIPLFKKQIEAGGPVTVTHPDIIRYFMTIPEAVSLVLTAAAKAKGGEIFVLDMGEPVKIVDLAKNMIRLSGLKEGEDIDIVFTGLRPGEKLYEELLMSEEGLQKTDNSLIYIGEPIPLCEKTFEAELMELKKVAEAEDTDIREYVKKIVPTYQPERSN